MSDVAAVEAGAGSATTAQNVVRVGLGAGFLVAGGAHLTWLREEFQALVPSWLPSDPDQVVVVSGVAELALGTAMVAASRRRVPVGWVSAGFLVAVFPGNLAQYVEGTDAFGLDTDRARATRLLVQPALVAAALWSTGAWASWRGRARLRP